MSRGDNTDELLVKLTRYLDYFQALTHLAKTLTAEIRLEDVLEVVMRNVSQLLEPRNWSLLLVDEATGELTFEITVGQAAEHRRGMRLKMGEGLAGWAALHRQPVVIPRVADDPRCSGRIDGMTSFRTASVVCTPLISRGRLLGVIELVRAEEEGPPFTLEHLQIIEPFGDFAAIAIDNARSFKRIEELTVVDEWTSLYNARFLREQLREEVTRARRYRHDLSVLFFDLDGFKSVNDTFGHAAGSEVLREVGNVVRSNIRETDKPVRYGGDEFVVLMPETSKDGAMALAERIRRVLASKNLGNRNDRQLSVSASFGVATFPNDASSPAELLETADRAMYLGKARGRNTVVDAAELQHQAPTAVASLAAELELRGNVATAAAEGQPDPNEG